jgi:hypothetical protein
MTHLPDNFIPITFNTVTIQDIIARTMSKTHLSIFEGYMIPRQLQAAFYLVCEHGNDNIYNLCETSVINGKPNWKCLDNKFHDKFNFEGRIQVDISQDQEPQPTATAIATLWDNDVKRITNMNTDEYVLLHTATEDLKTDFTQKLEKFSKTRYYILIDTTTRNDKSYLKIAYFFESPNQ